VEKRRLTDPHSITKRLASSFLVVAAFVGSVASASAQSGLTRIEQNDPSIVYSGNWYSNASGAHSAGLAALTNTRGARATLTFTGTGISWRGFRDQWSGIATVYVDGEAKGTIDCYLGAAQPQATLFVVNGLSAGEHRLTIEVTGRKGAGSQGTWVWIDAFDVIN
jgi:hypothetical protein